MHHLTRAAALAPLPLLAALLPSQSYKVSIIQKGLLRPTGIAVHASGDLYFTELPDPGKFSQRNTVSMRAAANGKVTAIVRGEPGPTNIAVLANRTFFWTCNTVGPVMQGDKNGHRTIVKANRPSGIALDGAGRIFITQVPQPGKKGGNNDVAEIVSGRIVRIKAGEPEPVDVAVDKAGNLYWTCKTAGVILRRDAKTKAVSFVLEGLEKPNGLAMDAAGNLYFTEIPTPGKSAAQGGRNRISKYDPKTRNLSVVFFGHPEPVDVTVTADGSAVYWTCATAGVIARADRMAAQPRVLSNSTTGIGDRVDMTLSAPGHGRRMYLAATSAGLGPIGIDTRFLGLAPDGLFTITITGQGAPTFGNYIGTLDAMGNARASIQLPNIAGLRGIALNTAFLTLDRSAMSGVAGISSTFRFEIR